MEAQTIKFADTQSDFRNNHTADTWSTILSNVEIAEDYKRAILTIPLFHVGANKKGLFWTEEMLKEIVPLYQGIPFRYDIDGQEGSSHTINKLSSPHFDIGWTYDGKEGAWYDPKTKALWVKGEITHPQVISKLQRETSDGKREVNYASMGIIVDEAKCSICGGEYGTCEHERGKKYLDGIAYKVPTKCTKGLHVALTNDPADAEAEISKCIFQEMGDSMIGQDYRAQTGTQNTANQLSNQTPGGLATSSPQTEQPGMAPSPETMLKDLAERIKTIEQKLYETATPELVNAAPQDQMMQNNMGTTTQFDETKGQMNTPEKEDGNMNAKDGQAKQTKTPVNPVPSKETQDLGNPMDNVIAMLQQILQKLNGGAAETQDVNELVNASKEKMQHDETKPTEHMPPGDAVSDSQDEGNKKNKENMQKPDMVATADNSDELKAELADLRKEVKELRGKLELQDNEVPEFGGSVQAKSLEVADLGAKGRREKFGEFGAFDAIFNGSKSAERFQR